jgi:RNA polymerase sigma factor (sigma-70 family)
VKKPPPWSAWHDVWPYYLTNSWQGWECDAKRLAERDPVNERAWTVLFYTYYRRLISYVKYRVGVSGYRDRAQEVAAQTLINLFVKFDQYDPRQPLENYVFRIARNIDIDWVRTPRKHREDTRRIDVDDVAWFDQPPSDCGYAAVVGARSERLLQHIDALGASHREILLTRDLSANKNGWKAPPYRVVGDRIGISEPAARQRRKRAFDNLRPRILADPFFEENQAQSGSHSDPDLFPERPTWSCLFGLLIHSVQHSLYTGPEIDLEYNLEVSRWLNIAKSNRRPSLEDYDAKEPFPKPGDEERDPPEWQTHYRQKKPVDLKKRSTYLVRNGELVTPNTDDAREFHLEKNGGGYEIKWEETKPDRLFLHDVPAQTATNRGQYSYTLVEGYKKDNKPDDSFA